MGTLLEAAKWVALALVVGCRSQSGPAEATASGGGARERDPGTRAPATLALEPEARIDWVELGPGRFAARASTPVTVATEIRLEEKTPSGTFAPVALERALRLAEPGVASSAGADCTALRGGEALAFEGWDGSACAGSRCPETGTDPRHAGVHRWVITGCSSTARWESPEFTLPKRLKALYRARAAAHLERASVSRLQALSARDGVAPAPDRLAGYLTVPNTEVTLSRELVHDLARWLSGPGFDDDVVRRCKRGSAFGFRGEREVPGVTSAEVTELAVDLQCDSVALIYEEGGARRRMDAYFDDSRAELLSILQRAIPGELRSRASR